MPNLLDVVKTGSRCKGSTKVYDQMDKGAKDFLRPKEKETNYVDGDEDANKTFWDIYTVG